MSSAIRLAEGNPTGRQRGWEFRVSLASFTATVRSDHPELLDRLARVYPHGVTSEPTSPDARFAALLDPVGGPEAIRLVQDGFEAGIAESATEALAHLEYLINTAALAALADDLQLHAGAVAARSGAMIVPGSSGAGKSTLSAALSLSGFAYLSDELALIDAGSARLRAFPKAICLKDGGWMAVRAAFGPIPGAMTALRAGGEAVHYLAAPRPWDSGTTVAARYVLLPRRGRTDGPRLRPHSRAQTVAELARHSLNLPRHGSHGLEVLARLVEGASCYTLEYHDLNSAVRAVESLVERDSERAGETGFSPLRGNGRSAA